MENIDGFSVEREANEIRISFYDIFGEGETYVIPVADARKVLKALKFELRPDDRRRRK
jgi:hypothetical protein